MSKRFNNVGKVNKYNYSISSILPLLFIVGVIPLIVRLKVIPLSGIRSTFKVGENINADLFSYYKMVWFLVATSIGVAIFFAKYYYHENIGIKKTKIYIPTSIYIFSTILSTIFATYRDVAKLGFMDRYENVYVLIGYAVCMVMAINLIDEEKQIKYLLYTLGISSIVLSTIGAFQFIGLDLFGTDFGKTMIIPSMYIESVTGLNFIFGKGRIYSTLFNPNYVGVYMSILFPLSCTILILSKNTMNKFFFRLVSILAFLNLLGSGSRAGMIGIILYIILLMIFFRTSIFKRWYYALAILGIMAIGFYGVNNYTEGLFKLRMINIKGSLLSTKKYSLEDIILENGRAKLVIDDYEINIVYEDGGFVFTDSNDDQIETMELENKYNFKEEPYNQHVFSKFLYGDNLLLKSQIMTNRGWANFSLVVDENDDFKFLNTKGKLIDLVKARSWGFEGREMMASSRGYIWSRSIPLMKDTLILGYGPDTYALHFPQEDYLGKLKAMSMTTLVDKPHNYYLQTGINTGVLSLIAVLAIFVTYIKSSFQVYISRKKYDDFLEVAGISIFFSICSYLMMGLLNDSVISVAPIFWILLGTGISINEKLRSS